jgi:hypothetical protein
MLWELDLAVANLAGARTTLKQLLEGLLFLRVFFLGRAIRAFRARVKGLGRLRRDISAEVARGRLGIIIEVEGAEDSGSAFTSYLIAFFTPFSFLIGAFRIGVGVRKGLEERIRDYLGC